MPELTQDEIICLTIMNDGQNMLSIGNWKKPIESLAEKKFARMIAQLNYVITPEGRQALEGHDQRTDDSFLRLTSQIKSTKELAARTLEMAAQNLADAAKMQHDLTGEIPNQAVWSLGQDIIKRALEILK